MLNTLKTATLEWIASLINNKKEKNFILDPLTCIIRLSLLNFKEIGTKISISDNRITYQEPNIFQGPIRWTHGDAREDLHNLYYPIVKATQWYDNKKNTILFKYARNGLRKLTQSYNRNSITSHSITHYISVIENFINNTSEKLPEIKKNNDSVNQIYKELQNLWTEREIHIICEMLVELNSVYESNKELEVNKYLNSIEELLLMKEIKVNDILLKSYTILD